MMTTDRTAAPGRGGAADAAAARLQALREQRAARPAGDRASRPAGAKPRRRHAATGARILAGGLSISLTMGLVAAMASADDTGGTAINTLAPAPAVVGIDRSSQTASHVVEPAPAPTVHPTDAAPVTSSQSS